MIVYRCLTIAAALNASELKENDSKISFNNLSNERKSFIIEVINKFKNTVNRSVSVIPNTSVNAPDPLLQ